MKAVPCDRRAVKHLDKISHHACNKFLPHGDTIRMRERVRSEA